MEERRNDIPPAEGRNSSRFDRGPLPPRGIPGERVPSHQSAQWNRSENQHQHQHGDGSFRRRKEQSNRGYHTEQPPPMGLSSSPSSSRWDNPSSDRNHGSSRFEADDHRHGRDHDRHNDNDTKNKNNNNNDNKNDNDNDNHEDARRAKSAAKPNDRHRSDRYADRNREEDRCGYYSRRRDDRYGDGGDHDGDDRYERERDRDRDSVRRGRERDESRRRGERGRGRGRYPDDENDRYRSSYRRRSDSEYSSDDDRGDSRRSERSRRDDRRRSSDRERNRDRDRSRRRSRSRDYRPDDGDGDGDGNKNKDNSNSNSNSNNNDKPKEWPPSFQNDGSAFTFDARSAMFYEPLSDFFYDPKSKLYYGNKKSAYYRYDETKEPPFVEVKRMTSEEVEEQQRGGGGGFSQEKLAMGDPAVPDASKPKIAIKLKTKKVRSSASTVAAIEGRNHHHQQQQQQAATTTTVSRAKKEQIANIGKWTEKQAELKHTEPGNVAATTDEGKQTPQGKVRTTVKGEPICALCKRKFPTLEKFRLHEKASELHKKNLLKLQEKKKNKQQQQQQQQQQGDSGIKRKLDENLTDASNVTPTSSNEPVYTDRAQKRRQLHGMDLSTPANGLHSLRRQDQRHGEAQVETHTHTHTQIDPTPGSDLLNETNVGHRMLQKLGYKQQPQPQQHNREQDQPADSGNGNKPRSANEHLRKEWDRIEAMAAKSKPRYHSNY